MLGEITHLQTISEDLKSLTMDPHKLPSSSEQVRVTGKHSGAQTKEMEAQVHHVLCSGSHGHPHSWPLSSADVVHQALFQALHVDFFSSPSLLCLFMQPDLVALRDGVSYLGSPGQWGWRRTWVKLSRTRASTFDPSRNSLKGSCEGVLGSSWLEVLLCSLWPCEGMAFVLEEDDALVLYSFGACDLNTTDM